MQHVSLQKGFTLIEVMIVVVIIGIIASIAYPSYTEYVNKSRRTDATTSLLIAAQQLERCYTRQNTYVGCPVPETSQDGHYSISATTQTPSTFTLEATPATGSPQTKDGKCTKFTLTHTGERGATGSLGADCW
ncbi:type IV pilin protein [Ectothiorhodospira shaposhnikovii]|uniref:type IV pilin protein n=1 Tax=Ectothiorhodospira shaposhnikovii TaxID=1054 RepID=UPI0023E83939|nr:type IV pilin protein [Ectothiorhodospira shaposhnikovii]